MPSMVASKRYAGSRRAMAFVCCWIMRRRKRGLFETIAPASAVSSSYSSMSCSIVFDRERELFVASERDDEGHWHASREQRGSRRVG